MKKRVYLAIFALTFGLCAGCGNKEADSDISGTEDTVFQTEEPLELSGTGNIDLSEENKDSGGENADSSEENNGSGEEDTDIESTDTQEIDFTRDYSEDIKKRCGRCSIGFGFFARGTGKYSHAFRTV